MSKQIKTAFILLTVLIVPFFLCGTASFAEVMSREEYKLQQIKNELFHQKRKLRITAEKERDALRKLYVLQGELKQAQKKINNANSSISYNKKQINQLTVDLDKYSKNLQVKNEMLKHRIKEIFKSRGGNLFEVIFGAVSMSDFLNRTYYFWKVIRSDVLLINETRNEVYSMNMAKNELQTSNRQIIGLIDDVKQQTISIKNKKAQRQEMYDILKSRRIAYQKRVAELEESSKELEGMIRKVVSERVRRGVVSAGTGRFGWPLKGRIVSGYGYRRHPLWGGYHLHTGLDIASPYGRSINSADKGEVIYSGWWDGYGKSVVIDHGRGYTTVYAHMSRVYVRAGDVVEQGQLIGLVGSTGFSTGPHLHFEIRKDGKPINPYNFL